MTVDVLSLTRVQSEGSMNEKPAALLKKPFGVGVGGNVGVIVGGTVWDGGWVAVGGAAVGEGVFVLTTGAVSWGMISVVGMGPGVVQAAKDKTSRMINDLMIRNFGKARVFMHLAPFTDGDVSDRDQHQYNDTHNA
jgi:hypothetical protein